MISGKSTKKLLLKSGRIIDPFSKKTFIGDILIENGKIAKINDSISSRGKDFKVIDCKGLVVTHGFCDIHAHFREPGREDKETLESGSFAAVGGGFTQVCTMANTDPIIDSPENIHYIVSKSIKLPIDIFPIGAVSKGLKGEDLTEMLLMQKNGAIAFSDDGMPIQNAQFMKLALTYAKMLDVPIMNHAEDIFLRNNGVMNASATSNNLGLKGNTGLAEAVMVYRDMLLAQSLNSKLHLLHISTKETVELLKKFNSNLIISFIKKHDHIMLQKFLPKISKGDKRVFIINGKVCGAISRIPKKGSILSNMSKGAKPVNIKLSLNENKISRLIAKDLKKDNIFFAGIDFIDQKLNGDINVTSPTGLKTLFDISKINLAKTFWKELKA